MSTDINCHYITHYIVRDSNTSTVERNIKEHDMIWCDVGEIGSSVPHTTYHTLTGHFISAPIGQFNHSL